MIVVMQRLDKHPAMRTSSCCWAAVGCLAADDVVHYSKIEQSHKRCFLRVHSECSEAFDQVSAVQYGSEQLVDCMCYSYGLCSYGWWKYTLKINVECL
jgi:hypothetical protein